MPNLIGDYLYKTLPPLYRVQDKNTNYTLQRYLDALGESMSLVNDETRGILTLLDVEKMEAKFLPHFASMFGVEYHYDIPEDSQRKYLANLVDIQKRKGTKEVLEFTARELTGMNATVKEGHNLKFKTWGRDPKDEKCGPYEPPRTFGGKSTVPYYFLGGKNTERFTVMVHLSTESTTDTEELFLNTQLLSRWTKELVQPYINLRYRASGISYSDERAIKVREWDSLRVIDKSTRKSRVVESEVYSRVRNMEGLTYSNNLVSKPLDRLRLLQDILDGNINDVQEVGTDTMKIVTKVSDNVVLNIFYKGTDLVTDTPTPYNLNTKVKVEEEFKIKDVDMREIEHLEMDSIHLIDSATSTINYEEDPSVDYIHSNIINDIMNIGERIETSFEDKITEINIEQGE